MSEKQRELSRLLAELGYKPLNRTWAKLEIVLGLSAAGLGLLLGAWAVSRANGELEWGFAAGALGLFILGSYLTLAGHRSHLYQSNNELTACLVDEIRRLKERVESR